MRRVIEASNAAFRSYFPVGDPRPRLDEPAPALYDAALASGWAEIDGIWALQLLLEGLHVSRSNYSDQTGFEVAANGRGIPDLDLSGHLESVPTLVSRGLRFARRALDALPAHAPAVSATVSFGPTAYDESVFTGNVTFWSDHEGEEPWITDIDRFDQGIVLLRSVPQEQAPQERGQESTSPFSIKAVSTEPPHPLDDGGTGRITIGNFTERFSMALSCWEPAQYEQSWRASLEVLFRDETMDSCLVASITDPVNSNFVFSWPLYRRGDDVFVHNAIVFLDELEVPFDPSAPWASVRARETVNEDGHVVSEWRTSISAIREFLDRDESTPVTAGD